MIERIRTQMIKHPNSTLWSKDRNKWDKEDMIEFEGLEKGKGISRKKRMSGGVPVKVIRISDGYIYPTVRACINQNGYHSIEMQQMLKDQIKYKRA